MVNDFTYRVFISAPVVWKENSVGMNVALYIIGGIAIILGILIQQGIIR